MNNTYTMDGLRKLAGVLKSSAELYFCWTLYLLGLVIENLPKPYYVTPSAVKRNLAT